MSRQQEIQGVLLHLVEPDVLTVNWVGQRELLTQLLAAWTVIDEGDLPLNPRLLGKPGVGKTTLAYAVARSLNQQVYIMQATMDTRPEDLIVLPVVGEDQKIRYVASPLVTAMITGENVRRYRGANSKLEMFANVCEVLRCFCKLLAGSFSAVSEPTSASKYAFCSIFQDLQDLQTSAPLRTQHFSKNRFTNQRFW